MVRGVRRIIVIIIALGVAVTVAVTVMLTGSGTIGPVAPGWSVLEECTPVVPGDTSGSVGSASLGAARTSTSRYVADNGAVLSSGAGSWYGSVDSVGEQGLSAQLTMAGRLGFAVADRTMPPVWFDDVATTPDFGVYGSGTGQVGTPYGLAVDPIDGGVWITSTGTVAGADRFKAIKFTSAGVYVTEIGSSGSGNGQFGGVISVAVSPVDQAVWIGDSVNYRIQKFTTSDGGLTYAYSTKVGAIGSGNGQFGSQQAIPVAVDSLGNVYAGDRGNSRIQKFNSSATYQAQVAVSGFDVLASGVPIYALTFDGSDVLYASLLTTVPGANAVGTIRSYNTSLVAQTTIRPTVPAGTNSGILNIAAANDGVWAHWGLGTELYKYNSAGVQIARWVSAYPAPTSISTNYAMAVNRATGDTYVLFRADTTPGSTVVYGGKIVTSFNYQPVTLSSAIERYLEACDANLGGMTYSYTATAYDVVFPGWQGNVWAKLKELCTAYNVEIVPIGNVITVRDVGSTTLTIKNNTPVRTTPSKGSGGKTVTVVAQNAVAGGGVMWDAATEGVTYSIPVGARQVITLATNNHPTELANPVPTDVLPILPGQYYVVDSAGTPVPSATWSATGGSVTVAVGSSPGTITLIIQGPSSGSGPFYFATGTASTSTGALSIVGPGVITTPVTHTILTASADQAQTVAAAINTPFINTRDQAFSRGLWASDEAAGPGVEIQFTMPVASLSGYGLTVGSMVTYESSKYRVKAINWGNLAATITATRRVTLGEVDTAWTGQTVGTRDTFWSGYSAGDRHIQPLLVAR
jgi:hypothetical protein